VRACVRVCVRACVRVCVCVCVCTALALCQGSEHAFCQEISLYHEL